MKAVKILWFLIAGVAIILFWFPQTPLQASQNDAFLVMANPAEDSSEGITIGWHTLITGTFVEITTPDNPAFHNPIRIMGECEPTSHTDTATKITYEENKCIARVSNLEADTEYIYRAGKSSFSQTNQFKTAPIDGSFSFVYMADVHIHNPIPARIQTAETLLARAKSVVTNISFGVYGGDMLAYGSAYDAWNTLANSTLSRTMMAAHTPGNHDFYDNTATSRGPGYFNNFLYNPNNGAEGVNNTSYFFRYHNTLFISISSEDSWSSSTLLENQKQWFSNVVENNPSQYIVVYTHRPFYNGSTSNSGHALTNRTNWSSIFDQYGVDIVLSGHDHVYVRTHRTFAGEVSSDSKKGTVYIGATAIGDRYVDAAPSTPYTNLATIIGGSNPLATIVTAGNAALTIRTINTQGVVVDQMTIVSKRDKVTYGIEEKQAFMDSLEVTTPTTQTTSATISYERLLTNYVYDITLVDGLGVQYGKQRVKAYSEAVMFHQFVPNRFIPVTAIVTFFDGEVYEKELTVNTKLPYGWIGNVQLEKQNNQYHLSWDELLQNDQIRKYELYVNNELVGSTRNKEEPILLSSLEVNKLHELEFVAIDRYNDVVYKETWTYMDKILTQEIVGLDQICITIGESIQIQVEVYPNYAFQPKLLWSVLDTDIIHHLENGLIEAIGIGTTILKVVEQESGVEKEIHVEVVPPYVEVENVEVVFDWEMTVGEERKPSVSIHPVDATNQEVELYSSNASVAFVAENGTIVALAAGYTQITICIEEEWQEVFTLVVKPSYVAIDTVTFDSIETMVIGTVHPLNPVVFPNNATNHVIVVSSNDDSVVLVQDGFNLKAIGVGIAEITIRILEELFVWTLYVEVKEEKISVTEIIVQIPTELTIGDTHQLEVLISPENATNQTILFQSLTPTIASISEDGLILALKSGIARIRITVDGIERTVEIEIQAQEQPRKGCGFKNEGVLFGFLGVVVFFIRRRKT